jgi:hypothetical protein
MARSASVRRRPRRSLLNAVAPLIVAGTLTLAATAAAAGLGPANPTPLPDSAFAPVTAPSPAAGGFAVPAARSTDVLSDIPQPERAQPSVRAPKPIVVQNKPVTTHAVSGRASWYCRAGVSPCTNTQPDVGGFDAYAAAGPKLRAAIGPSWRGSIVWVDGIRVKLIDWCQCYRGEPQEKLLDLYFDVYARTGTAVTIRW